jgi:HD-like signal output (HDOD) protein
MEINEKITDLVRSKRTELPTLPVVVENILSAAREERASAKDLADFIGKDQAISNKILRLANSAYYGLMKKVDSISRAITIIGFNEVIGLTIGMSVFSAFRQKDLHGIFGMRDLWLHSIGCASAAKEVAKKTGSSVAEQIFLSGLLHDMGKVIFAAYFPKEYRTVLKDAKKSETLLYHKEKEILGIDHAMLSGLLMENWHFPDSLLLPSRFHHNSVECPLTYRHHAMIVELADFLCQKAQIGHSGNPVIPKSERISGNLGISLRDMEMIVSELNEQRSKIEDFLELTT